MAKRMRFPHSDETHDFIRNVLHNFSLNISSDIPSQLLSVQKTRQPLIMVETKPKMNQSPTAVWCVKEMHEILLAKWGILTVYFWLPGKIPGAVVDKESFLGNQKATFKEANSLIQRTMVLHVCMYVCISLGLRSPRVLIGTLLRFCRAPFVAVV